MGYYDAHYRKHRKKRSGLLNLFMGTIIGGILVLVLFPTFREANFLQEDASEPISTTDNNDWNNREYSNNNAIQNLSVNVSSQITDIVGNVAPSVVGVVNIQSQSNYWLEHETSQAGTGSGVIYKRTDGTAYVVTNHHVISGADEVEVVLSNGTHVQAELLGSDLFTDLAVLEMDSAQVQHVIDIGNSNNVKVGEPAIAIGSPLGLYLSGSVTQGIISGKQRAIPQDFDMDGRADWQAEVIQTDAAINPGNSGGALINMDGQLIGINSMKIAQSAVEGIGFAIPINDAIPIIEQLEQYHKVTRAYLGVESYSIDELPTVEWQRTLLLPKTVESGIYLRSIEPMSPADRAGLQEFDVITHLDGVPMIDIISLRKHLYQEKQPGDEMSVTYYRDGEKRETTITLAAQEY
ncbi:S1C family serine protease [Radiobacillus sp. PE A8.2]|uniref:S1C family serine protease n=1 Tax=Radiobacillus sp. PE A8.2 TaxID=3380349 RepID=UPI00388F6121